MQHPVPPLWAPPSRPTLDALRHRRHSSLTRVSLDGHAVKSWTGMVAKSRPASSEIPARHARNTQPVPSTNGGMFKFAETKHSDKLAMKAVTIELCAANPFSAAYTMNTLWWLPATRPAGRPIPQSYKR